jgi:hypothetical protein
MLSGAAYIYSKVESILEWAPGNSFYSSLVKDSMVWQTGYSPLNWTELLNGVVIRITHF